MRNTRTGWPERTPSESDLARMRIEGKNLPYQPVISLVVPVYNTPEEYLSLMVDSVMAQTYGKWELCLADDASTAPHVRPFLDRLARRDPRVKVAHLPRNQGIAGASNAALALATGEFIGLLDHDDVLAPSALFEVVRALNDAPETDLIYSDEDKVDDTGEDALGPVLQARLVPRSAALHQLCVPFRRLPAIAGRGHRRLSAEYDGSQDYDLVLRFTERTNRIVHLPSVLYSWRDPGLGRPRHHGQAVCRGRRAARHRRRAPAARGGGARRTRLLPGASGACVTTCAASRRSRW